MFSAIHSGYCVLLQLAPLVKYRFGSGFWVRGMSTVAKQHSAWVVELLGVLVGEQNSTYAAILGYLRRDI